MYARQRKARRDAKTSETRRILKRRAYNDIVTLTGRNCRVTVDIFVQNVQFSDFSRVDNLTARGLFTTI